MYFKKILIANRGEIAVRILTTLKKIEIESIIVYHQLDAQTPAVQMADQSVEIFNERPVAAYLDIEQIIAACKSSGAEAVHPGFGFLSENPEFVTRLQQEGIVFIGPSADAIRLMGNKVRARAFCLEHGFPIAPSVIDEGDEEAFISKAKDIGVPLLIKAAAGGGGKGMHIVYDPVKIEESIAMARGEAQRSFGNSQVYAERYVERSRHIEVQILADQHGSVLHLGERECSIQRRFQKVIEEAPSATLTTNQREDICNTATAIADKAGYSNAGTIEFIYAPDGTFYFLEMNTRIQVEHPVTEMITGIDLVEEQVRVAYGKKLSKKQADIKLLGHAIEVRLYAEDADNDFTPATGTLHKYQLPQSDTRIENGFLEGQQVSSAFDPMLAKIIVHGSDRAQAITKMIATLQKTLVLGVTTNRDFLIRVLNHPSFRDNKIHTHFIPENAETLKKAPLSADEVQILLGITAMMSRDLNDPNARVQEPHISIGNWGNQ